jgi:hypothetical protein
MQRKIFQNNKRQNNSKNNAKRKFKVNYAQVAELVYAYDSKSYDRKVLWVRVPPWAQIHGSP